MEYANVTHSDLVGSDSCRAIDQNAAVINTVEPRCEKEQQDLYVYVKTAAALN